MDTQNPSGLTFGQHNIIKIRGDVFSEDKIMRSQLEELNGYLSRAVAQYETQMLQPLISQLAPEKPYKFLSPFDLKDANIFFGRDAVTEALHQVVLKKRITVLHGKSGAGKISAQCQAFTPIDSWRGDACLRAGL